jgi:hypothetical protein
MLVHLDVALHAPHVVLQASPRVLEGIVDV